MPASSPLCPPQGFVFSRVATRPSIRRTAALLVVLVAALVQVARAEADPLASRRAQAAQVLGEIQELDARVSRAVDAYNAARIRLDEIRKRQAENRHYLAVARANYHRAQQALQARVLELYTSNSPTGLEVLLGSESLEDLLSRAEAVERVTSQDRRVVSEIARFRAEMKRRRAELARARAEQEDAVAELTARRREIEGQLAARRALLASIRSEIERIEAEERRREQRLEAQARARLASQSSSSGTSDGSGSSGSTYDSGAVGPGYGASEATGGGAPPARYGAVVAIAMRYLGVPYRWGGASPSTGFDCSGFVMYVYAQVGVSLPHNAAMQYGYGSPVSRGDLQPGDIVFFNGLGHNGIYVGGGSFIHSPHTGDVVKISSLSDSWYASTYVGARRL
ncbi:MAG: NlpC/P60 family protein [Actinomycetota bacterium]|nr:NlpC/P60 family protein [Actinomycetota bacterium]